MAAAATATATATAVALREQQQQPDPQYGGVMMDVGLPLLLEDGATCAIFVVTEHSMWSLGTAAVIAGILLILSKIRFQSFLSMWKMSLKSWNIFPGDNFCQY